MTTRGKRVLRFVVTGALAIAPLACGDDTTPEPHHTNTGPEEEPRYAPNPGPDELNKQGGPQLPTSTGPSDPHPVNPGPVVVPTANPGPEPTGLAPEPTGPAPDPTAVPTANPGPTPTPEAPPPPHPNPGPTPTTR